MSGGEGSRGLEQGSCTWTMMAQESDMFATKMRQWCLQVQPLLADLEQHEVHRVTKVDKIKSMLMKCWREVRREACGREERPQDHHRQSLIWAQTRAKRPRKHCASQLGHSQGEAHPGHHVVKHRRKARWGGGGGLSHRHTDISSFALKPCSHRSHCRQWLRFRQWKRGGLGQTECSHFISVM